MKSLKSISLLLLFVLSTLGLSAQNGNFVISSVKLYDMGNGTGILAARVSGNLAYRVTGGYFTATGAIIPGGSVSGGMGDLSRIQVQAPTPGNGNGGGNTNPNGVEAVILTATVPLSPSTGNGPDFVDIDLRVEGDRVFYHWGSTVSTCNP